MKPFWKNQELEDAKSQSHVLLDTTHIYDKIPSLFPKEYLYTESFTNTPVHVTDSLWSDSGLKNWTNTQGYLRGSKYYLWNFLQQPIYDKDCLVRRQKTLSYFSKVATKDKLIENLQIIQSCEKNILWILNLPSFTDLWPLNLAFPTIPILKYINYYPIPLLLFHIYKIFIAPIMNIITPFSTIIGPWIYLRRNLKIQLSFKAYSNILLLAFKQGFKSSGNIKLDSIKFFSIFIYIFFYIYSIIQCFEHAKIVYTILKNLYDKLESIKLFIKSVQELIDLFPKDILTDFLPKTFECSNKITLPDKMTGMYVLLTDNKLKQSLKSLLLWSYGLDSNYSIYKLLLSRKCCIVNYNDEESKLHTQYWNMGHIILDKQIRNPLNLNKNLIITGPNAAGKSTYVRAVCTNTILSQTFGLACALRANVLIVHALGSFMRIEDTLGEASLFEAEAKRCAELLEQAESISVAQKRALYFLDEPMHSTPPIEGTATSMAVIEYMGKLSGIRLLVTTHYHDCIKLESMHPKYYKNISMDAYNKNGTYIFPYKIKNGASVKCIALELLHEKNLPKNLIERAIVLKNKICQQELIKSNNVQS